MFLSFECNCFFPDNRFDLNSNMLTKPHCNKHDGLSKSDLKAAPTARLVHKVAFVMTEVGGH